MIRPDWTPQKALWEQVEKEDTAKWAEAKEEEGERPKPLPSTKTTKASLYAFFHSMLP